MKGSSSRLIDRVVVLRLKYQGQEIEEEQESPKINAENDDELRTDSSDSLMKAQHAVQKGFHGTRYQDSGKDNIA